MAKSSGVSLMEQDHATKRKTSFQLESLENFYGEENYPTQKAMEDYAAALNLTYKQVRGWFVERRRKEKREKDVGVKNLPSFKCLSSGLLESGLFKKNHSFSSHQGRHKDRRFSALDAKGFMAGRGKIRQMEKINQGLLTSDYILKKVFRKDGPPLGIEFDSLPPGALHHQKDSRNSCTSCGDNERVAKRRKISKPSDLSNHASKKNSAPLRKHGIGKGLMTVWRATNPDGGDIPTGVSFTVKEAAGICPVSTSKSQKPRQQKRWHQILNEKRLETKLQNRRKPSMKRRKVERNIEGNQMQLPKEKCKLALDGERFQDPNVLAMLVDDEELELRELQAGPNPLTCSAHLAINGMHGCSLCKDLLARFPPHSVKMKQPFCMQPWNSSPMLVKKLFKILHFLYTNAVAVDVCLFTLDELAQAFHDKDSLLLGKIHMALLKLLLSDVESDLGNGCLPRLTKNCRFLGFLQSIECQEIVVQFWKKYLNPLTWTEIMRQVLIAAGFGSRKGAPQRGALNKEGNCMSKYGLRPGTLKGELFSILSEHGNNGSKLSELAKCSQIVELNLANTTDELEHLICSTLSSDITLFEKISPSAYRLRINTISKEAGSDTEDSGSVDDDCDTGIYSCSDDSDGSELDSSCISLSNPRNKGHRKRNNNMLTVYNEIDESHPGEVWVLGLMESEYSDLSIEEKLNALEALVDLTSAGSTLRSEDPSRIISESIPDACHRGSGAKIKKSSARQQNFTALFWGNGGQMNGSKEGHSLLEFLPVDSSAAIFKSSAKEKSKRNTLYWPDNSETMNAEAIKNVDCNVHPMQSIYLGSDRRYNKYWLFLGPCHTKDPGHRRVYFESSEDGHWEVIDTKEALGALLSVLDCRGTREAFLLESLEKREAFLCQQMSKKLEFEKEIRPSVQSDQSEIDIISGDGSSPISDIDNHLFFTETENDASVSSGVITLELEKKEEVQRKKWKRLQAFDTWIWDSFYSELNAVKHSKSSYLDSLTRCESCHDLYWRDEKHCKACHTTFELDFDLEERYAIHVATCREEDVCMFPKHKVLSSQLQSLKAAIYAIEAVMPENALVGDWTRSTHKLWVNRLRRTSSIAELLQVLTDFVSAINEDWLSQCNAALCSGTALEDIIVFFPTIPQTTSAIALWLVKLDALIAPYLERVNTKTKRPQERSTRVKGRCALS